MFNDFFEALGLTIAAVSDDIRKAHRKADFEREVANLPARNLDIDATLAETRNRAQTLEAALTLASAEVDAARREALVASLRTGREGLRASGHRAAAAPGGCSDRRDRGRDRLDGLQRPRHDLRSAEKEAGPARRDREGRGPGVVFRLAAA